MYHSCYRYAGVTTLTKSVITPFPRIPTPSLHNRSVTSLQGARAHRLESLSMIRSLSNAGISALYFLFHLRDEKVFIYKMKTVIGYIWIWSPCQEQSNRWSWYSIRRKPLITVIGPLYMSVISVKWPLTSGSLQSKFWRGPKLSRETARLTIPLELPYVSVLSVLFIIHPVLMRNAAVLFPVYFRFMDLWQMK